MRNATLPAYARIRPTVAHVVMPTTDATTLVPTTGPTLDTFLAVPSRPSFAEPTLRESRLR